jgi:superfamily II DNA/RNA helicase
LNEREGAIIVFVKTKINADRIATRLSKERHEAAAIHGDLRQQKRIFIVENFRKQLSRIMVATDIAARGIDVPHVQHVVNYDLPQSPEDYLHRIGRTGRAGNQGFAISLISPSDNRLWANIQRFLDGKSYNSNLRIDGFNRVKNSRDSFFQRSRRDDYSSDRKNSFSHRLAHQNEDYKPQGYKSHRSGEKNENEFQSHKRYYSQRRSDEAIHTKDVDSRDDRRNYGFRNNRQDDRPHYARQSNRQDERPSYGRQRKNNQSKNVKHKISTSF